MDNTDPQHLAETIAVQLGITIHHVLCDYDKKWPECLNVIVLKDVNPNKMSSTMRLVGDLGVQRICANIVEQRYAEHLQAIFKNQGFEAAFKESWNVNIATSRWE